MLKHWKLIAANFAAVGLGIYFATFGFSLPHTQRLDPNQIDGLFWPAQKQLAPFSLTDHENQEFNLQDFEEGWHLIFFGYTYCPDICPITMSTLREAHTSYQAIAKEEFKDLTMTFVSVDGERDHPEHLANYIRFYSEAFVAASGDKASVDSLTTQLGVPYEIDPHEPGDTNYLVAHTGTLFLIAPGGKLMATIQPPLTADGVVQNIMEIREFVASQS
ncbi:MAG: SCO family protein [Granulosicoccus sp.]|nr:SCO family protein [Granulosicoccus sp.]